MRRKERPPAPDLLAQWQKDQGAQCGCRGSDDFCACQNEIAPWKYGLAPWPPIIDWQARATAAEAQVSALTRAVEERDEALAWITSFAAIRAKDDSKTFAKVGRGAMRTIAERAASLLDMGGGDG